MPGRTNIYSINKRTRGLVVRGALLIIQILLPFGLYFALRSAHGLAAGLIATLFLISMLILVWLG
jgi:hypothetical protein